MSLFVHPASIINNNVSKRVNISSLPLLPFLYIILAFVTFLSTSNIAGINFNYWFRYIFAFLWCVVSILTLSKRKNRILDCCKNLFFMMMPFVIMLYLMPLMYICNNQSLNFTNISRSFSFFIQRFILIATAILSAKLFKRKAITYTFISLTLAYLCYIFVAIGKFGLSTFIEYLFSASSDKWNVWQSSSSIVEYLETHDITFAFGFFFLYYLFFYNEKHKWMYVFIATICIWLGFKRIEILSLFICVFVYLFLVFHNRTLNTLNKRLVFLFFAVTVVLLAFIYIVGNGEITQIAERYGINFNGRLKNYKILSNYYTFSPLYIGRGYCFTSLLVNNVSELEIVHSDILKSYIDFGFIGFILWVSFYMIMFPKKIGKLMKNLNISDVIKESVLIAVFSAYSMINYLTDNVYNYFTYQIVYLLIPFALYFEKNDKGYCLWK